MVVKHGTASSTPKQHTHIVNKGRVHIRGGASPPPSVHKAAAGPAAYGPQGAQSPRGICAGSCVTGDSCWRHDNGSGCVESELESSI